MDQVELSRSFRFEAAHRLTGVPAGHKCAQVHGHSYEVEITVRGPIDETTGWLMDFAEIDARVTPLRSRLSHSFLNEVEGLENPTSENLARWIWRSLAPHLPALAAVTVHETDRSRCVYRGPVR
jgi:6-pyruvoyltetrahydropterin/6-carboxytetrahydropterin synthase